MFYLLDYGVWIRQAQYVYFFKPFTEGMSKLYKGIELYSPDIKATFYAELAMVYNMTQFNGYDVIATVYKVQSGKSLKIGQRGDRVHVYPYIQDNPECSGKQLDQHSHEAISNQESVFGMKGPSWLSLVPDYNVIKGNVVDYMHCVLLGVTKMLLRIWFDSEHSKEVWYCGSKVFEVDSRLLQIKPPLTITRTPRSI